MWLGVALSLWISTNAFGGPYVPAGDLALRADLQRLADHGVLSGPVTTWPMAWGPVLRELRDVDGSTLSPAVADALERVRSRAEWETDGRGLRWRASAAVAEKPAAIRSFQNTPRGNAEVSAGAGWLGDRFNVEINLQGVDSDQDAQAFRADDSMIGVVAGNWAIAASTQQRWWGPAWDGSLILSSNARPFPAIMFDRIATDAFETRWLSWIGPWDLNVIFGQLEEERYVPNAQFFGMRFNFRPIPSLEIGLSRSAQWCGDGRPCDLDTFWNLFIGKDNRGGEGIDPENEPGNQLAGVDFRWAPGFLRHSVALYGQFIGEDEAGGFPSRYLGQFGLDWQTYIFNRWSATAFAEFSGTSCQFHESSKIFNCAYNHQIYQTGYRYRSRSIGHPADNDAQVVSAGVVLVDAGDTQWRALLRLAKLNMGGQPDPANSLTPTPQDVASLDVSHSRVFAFGVIDGGIGYETADDALTGSSTSDTRAYLQWRSAY